MTAAIKGKRVAFLTTDGVEEVEYTEPRKAVEQAGGTAELLSIKTGPWTLVEAVWSTAAC
jgi:protease I